MRMCLPQYDTKSLQSERRAELERTREDYAWHDFDGLPPYVAEVPDSEGFTTRAEAKLFSDMASTAAGLGLSSISRTLKRIFQGGRTLSWYDQFYPVPDVRARPTVARRWRRDDEFGRQRLCGVNPVTIELCREIPEHFPVTEKVVERALPRGERLARLLDEGRLFISDYRHLEGVPAKKGRYMVAPMALFYVDSLGDLMPLAIQLGQSPASGPIFTPDDPHWLWLYVKSFVQAADAVYHEVVVHLLRTHMCMEAFGVAMRRNLPARHPIHELLAPHFQFTMAINHGARTDMLAPEGPIDETLAPGAAGCIAVAKESYKEWTFTLTDLSYDLIRRGVAEKDRLPGYHYRDDALLVSEAIEDFVANVLGEFYKTDADVSDDAELQAWGRELASPEGGRVRRLPGDGRFSTRAEVNRVVSQVIFTCSAEHASVNNGQYDLFGFVPNVPGALYGPPPTSKDLHVTERELCQRLPGSSASVAQISMVHLLSSPTDTPLGVYPDSFFQEHPKIGRHVGRFTVALRLISKAIRERNETIEVPYTYLDPAQIPRSIAI